ncbi:hypothetical protein [Nocardia sp. NPDC004722]
MTDAEDQTDTDADDYTIVDIWTGRNGEGGSTPDEGWTVYTPRHLRGVLANLLRDVHFAMLALGAGPDSLRLEFQVSDEPSHRYARLDLTPAEIWLYARISERSRTYLSVHGFTVEETGWRHAAGRRERSMLAQRLPPPSYFCTISASSAPQTARASSSSPMPISRDCS